MKGAEELQKRGYLVKGQLRPDKGELYGRLTIGETAFATLAKFFKLSLDGAKNFLPLYYRPSGEHSSLRPDELIIKDNEILCVVEYKAQKEISSKKKLDEALEQLQTYLLITGAKVGLLTDNEQNYWLHNFDKERILEIKLVKDLNGLFNEAYSDTILKQLIVEIDAKSDTIKDPKKLDPSQVARSIWQSVYIATKENPEKCFQTFVELFNYKLLSDWGILPERFRIDQLNCDESRFNKKFGTTQIEYYITEIRRYVKEHLFPPLAAPTISDPSISYPNCNFPLTRSIIENSSEKHLSGKTSVIDGHAFERNPKTYNDAFIGILQKLDQLEAVKSLDPGFKSRIYEQFLRRDPNITKASGKYFTPRNVVRCITQLADLERLPEGSIVCDPACGVGGFITESYLELTKKSIDVFSDKKGIMTSKYKFVGFDCEYDIICLAKANTLLHSIEFYNSLSTSGRDRFQKVLSDSFVFCNYDTELGTLFHPVDSKIDLIMANPPYIVNGTGSVSKKINKNPMLEKYYSAGGSGLESRFINWIVNSLKPGGRAFVVVPKSMLARTEKSIKELILKNCFIDCLIYLPKDTFYTTPVETYIVGLTKKSDVKQKQNYPVFSFLVSEIGETRDVKRDPERNDLNDVVKYFKTYLSKRLEKYKPNSDRSKLIPFSEFTSTSRWDVDYFWSIDEKRTLGIIDREQLSVDSLISKFTDLASELRLAKDALDNGKHTVKNKFISIQLSNSQVFRIYRGNRVTKKEVKSAPGKVIVIASGRHSDSYFGSIAIDYLQNKFKVKSASQIPGYFDKSENKLVVTVGATGSVGVVHIRNEEKWFLHDDALAIEILDPKIDIHYFRYALQHAIQSSQFGYSAKLYVKRLEMVSVELPLETSGAFDLLTQHELAKVYKYQETIKNNVFNAVRDLVGTDVLL